MRSNARIVWEGSHRDSRSMSINNVVGTHRLGASESSSQLPPSATDARCDNAGRAEHANIS